MKKIVRVYTLIVKLELATTISTRERQHTPDMKFVLTCFVVQMFSFLTHSSKDDSNTCNMYERRDFTTGFSYISIWMVSGEKIVMIHVRMRCVNQNEFDRGQNLNRVILSLFHSMPRWVSAVIATKDRCSGCWFLRICNLKFLEILVSCSSHYDVRVQ